MFKLEINSEQSNRVYHVASFGEIINNFNVNSATINKE